MGALTPPLPRLAISPRENSKKKGKKRKKKGRKDKRTKKRKLYRLDCLHIGILSTYHETIYYRSMNSTSFLWGQHMCKRVAKVLSQNQKNGKLVQRSHSPGPG